MADDSSWPAPTWMTDETYDITPPRLRELLVYAGLNLDMLSMAMRMSRVELEQLLAQETMRPGQLFDLLDMALEVLKDSSRVVAGFGLGISLRYKNAIDERLIEAQAKWRAALPEDTTMEEESTPTPQPEPKAPPAHRRTLVAHLGGSAEVRFVPGPTTGDNNDA